MSEPKKPDITIPFIAYGNRTCHPNTYNTNGTQKYLTVSWHTWLSNKLRALGKGISLCQEAKEKRKESKRKWKDNHLYVYMEHITVSTSGSHQKLKLQVIMRVIFLDFLNQYRISSGVLHRSPLAWSICHKEAVTQCHSKVITFWQCHLKLFLDNGPDMKIIHDQRWGCPAGCKLDRTKLHWQNTPKTQMQNAIYVTFQKKSSIGFDLHLSCETIIEVKICLPLVLCSMRSECHYRHCFKS